MTSCPSFWAKCGPNFSTVHYECNTLANNYLELQWVWTIVSIWKGQISFLDLKFLVHRSVHITACKVKVKKNSLASALCILSLQKAHTLQLMTVFCMETTVMPILDVDGSSFGNWSSFNWQEGLRTCSQWEDDLCCERHVKNSHQQIISSWATVGMKP